MRKWSLPILSALVVLAACETSEPDETGSTTEAVATDAAAIEETIRARAQEFDDAVAAKDAARVAALYTDDAIVQAPNEPPTTGASEVQADWAETFEQVPDATGDGETETVIVGAGGDLAVETGRFSFSGTGPDGVAFAEDGKYLTVWKLQDDGSWMIVAESYSPNAPAGGADADATGGTEAEVAPGE